MVKEWRAAKSREQETKTKTPKLDGRDAGAAATISPPVKLEIGTSTDAGRAKGNNTPQASAQEDPDILVSNSLEAALYALYHDYSSRLSQDGRRGLGKVFVIGGATIYASALRLDPTTLGHKMRIVMTDIRRRGMQGETAGPALEEGEEGIEQATQPEGNEAGVDGFECDTFFPIDDLVHEKEWREASPTEITEWVGEDVSGDWKREGDVMLRVKGFERV
jgi:dihydrofolate reductase